MSASTPDFFTPNDFQPGFETLQAAADEGAQQRSLLRTGRAHVGCTVSGQVVRHCDRYAGWAALVYLAHRLW